MDLLKSEQERLARELGYLEERLSALELSSDAVEKNLRRALGHVANLHGAYVSADHRTRRLINQSVFERFTISDDGEIVGELKAPFGFSSKPPGWPIRMARSGLAAKQNREPP